MSYKTTKIESWDFYTKSNLVFAVSVLSMSSLFHNVFFTALENDVWLRVE